VKQKTMHQSSFRSATIKTTVLVASAFFLAHTVFGAPKPMARAQDGAQAPISIFAKLSIPSQLLISDLQGLVNKGGLLPANSVVTAPFVLQTLAENRESLSLSINGTVSSLEKRVELLKEMCEKTRDGWLKAKLLHLQKQLAVLKTFSEQTTPKEQKQLLSEIGKTFVVPIAP